MTFDPRATLQRQATNALRAGLLVSLGTRVLAWRKAGEPIWDGDHSVEPIVNGLFERIRVEQWRGDKQVAETRRWMLFRGECDLHDVVGELIAGLDDYAVAMHSAQFTAAAALSQNSTIRDSLRNGTRLPDDLIPEYAIG